MGARCVWRTRGEAADGQRAAGQRLGLSQLALGPEQRRQAAEGRFAGEVHVVRMVRFGAVAVQEGCGGHNLTHAGKRVVLLYLVQGVPVNIFMSFRVYQ